MLKGIPPNLSPDLLKILSEMGHGDDIVVADGNFPASNYAKRLVRADCQDIPSLLDSVLLFFPLDTFVKFPIKLMQIVDQKIEKPQIWDTYKNALNKGNNSDVQVEYLERYDFYEKAKEAYAIIATSETALYANVILKKGIIGNY